QLLDLPEKRVALKVLHDHVRRTELLEESENADDAGMVDARDGASFAEELLEAVAEELSVLDGMRANRGAIGATARELSRQILLNGHRTLEYDVDGQVHDTEAARSAEDPLDPILTAQQRIGRQSERVR